MTKKFRDLRAKMSPESQAKANEKAQDLLSGLPFAIVGESTQLWFYLQSPDITISVYQEIH